MEIKFKKGDSIAIPDGCKATVKDNVIIFEQIEQEFKRGDFLRRRGDWIFILDFIDEKGVIYYKVLYDIDEKAVLGFNDCGIGCFSYDIRLATPEEKDLLLSKMHEAGKEWDEEKCEIVDYRWRAEKGKDYFIVSSKRTDILKEGGDSIDYELHSIGNYFKTIELAEIALEKRNKLFLTLKHS